MENLMLKDTPFNNTSNNSKVLKSDLIIFFALHLSNLHRKAVPPPFLFRLGQLITL